MTVMRGYSVKRVRVGLGIDAFALAAMLGVHVSTIYRWEGALSIAMDPLQRELMQKLIDAPPESLKSIGVEVQRGLIKNGMLGGLLALLIKLEKL